MRPDRSIAPQLTSGSSPRRRRSDPARTGRGGRPRGLESEQGDTTFADHLPGAHRTGRRSAGGTRHSPDATADEIAAEAQSAGSSPCEFLIAVMPRDFFERCLHMNL